MLHEFVNWERSKLNLRERTAGFRCPFARVLVWVPLTHRQFMASHHCLAAEALLRELRPTALPVLSLGFAESEGESEGAECGGETPS